METKINFRYEDKPMILEMHGGSKFSREMLQENKTIIIEINLATKTRVATSLRQQYYVAKFNWTSEKFKTDAVESMSFWDYKSYTQHYFKKSKKQGWNEYLEYLKENIQKLLNNHLLKIDELEVIFFTQDVRKVFNVNPN